MPRIPKASSNPGWSKTPPPGLATPPPNNLLLTLLLGMFWAIPAFSMDTTLASMPSMAAAFGTSYAAIQFSLNAFMFGVAVGQLVHGPLSDRFGRLPVIFAGLAVYLVAAVGCATAESVETLIAFRLVQGIAACTGYVIVRAMLRDLFEREEAARTLSYVLLVHATAPLIAPILGAYIVVGLDWRWAFWFLVLYCGVLGILLWIFLQETNNSLNLDALRLSGFVGNYILALRDREFLGYTFCNACSLGGVFAFLSSSASVIIDYFGASTESYGYLFAATAFGNVCGFLIGGKAVRWIGVEKLLAIGASGMFCSGVAIAGLPWAGVNSVAAVLVPMFFFLVSSALIVPQAQAGGVSPFPQFAGTASSLMGFLQISFASLVGAMVGYLEDGTHMPMVTTIGLVGVGPLAIYMLVLRRPRARTD